MQNVDLVPALDHFIQADALTEAQKHSLAKINETLTAIEQDLKKEALAFNVIYQSRVGDAQAAHDCEVEAEISFYLSKRDPAYDEDKDNILAILTESLKGYQSKNLLADGLNHNEFQHIPHHPMKDECHCWLYHCLYDHTGMGWANLLRIGSIWVDIHCTLQGFYSLET